VARGIVALHNFEYEEANEAFQQARTLDPTEALAYWGEAMTYNQTLWRNENVAAAREALGRLGPTPEARAAKVADRRTRALVGAVEVLFGNGDASSRRRLYADAMARVHEQFPDDPDIAAFYALAMLGTASRSLIGNMDAHDRALAGSKTQRRVADVLQRVLASHPNHPGALHYLIHDYDDPDHARLALGAARAYAKVAAASSHALHMPAHVFLQLGFWHDAAQSDRAAYAASKEWVSRKQLGPAMRNYHALEWLQYELLQLGRYREAASLIDDLKWVVDAKGPLPLLSDWSSMRGRFVVETRRWKDLAGESNFGNADDLFAIGVSTARTGALDRAEVVRKALAQRATAEQEGDLRPAIAIMEREVAGLIALASGRRDEAIAILQAAVDAELRLPAPLGLPQPVKPAPELLGEVLLEASRPADAQKAFEQALRRNANRSLSVVGLARASAAQGQTAAARRHYQQLLANFDRADADLPEVKEARAAMRGSPGGRP
jgi:tetratricopeptide (TPR) repeat protein